MQHPLIAASHYYELFIFWDYLISVRLLFLILYALVYFWKKRRDFFFDKEMRLVKPVLFPNILLLFDLFTMVNQCSIQKCFYLHRSANLASVSCVRGDNFRNYLLLRAPTLLATNHMPHNIKSRTKGARGQSPPLYLVPTFRNRTKYCQSLRKFQIQNYGKT